MTPSTLMESAVDGSIDAVPGYLLQLFIALSFMSTSQLFFCPNCHLERQGKEIAALNDTIQSLTKAIPDLCSHQSSNAAASALAPQNQDGNTDTVSPVSRSIPVPNAHANVPSSSVEISKPSLQRT